MQNSVRTFVIMWENKLVRLFMFVIKKLSLTFLRKSKRYYLSGSTLLEAL